MPEIARKRAKEKHPGKDVKMEEAGIEELEQEGKELEEVKKVEEETGIKIIEEKWTPKTGFGRDVASDKITDINQIFSSPKPLLEQEVIDKLVPDLENALLNIGQSKGKFGGGKRSIWRQTQKKTKEGNKPKFATYAVVGNRNGYVGVGYGKAKETMPAREKAIKNAKLNLISIKRGCGSWACGCKEQHSIPFNVSGKSGSVRVILKPAPKGTGLLVESQMKKILELAGIKDIHSQTFGQTRTKINLVKACFNALKELSKIKIQSDIVDKLGIKQGKI